MFSQAREDRASEPRTCLAAIGSRNTHACGTRILDVFASKIGSIGSTSISVLSRSPSVPGRSLPRAGYQIALGGIETAGNWALKHRPSSRALQIPAASCSAPTTFLLESHFSTRHRAQLGRWGRAGSSLARVSIASPRWQEPARMRAPWHQQPSTYASLRVDVEIQAFVRARTGGHQPSLHAGHCVMATESPKGPSLPPR